MDTVTASKPEADERFDTARITAEIDALAASHAGNGDLFRTAMAQLLKAEFVKAREAAQASCCRIAMAGAAPSGCASSRTKSSACCYEAATRHLYQFAEAIPAASGWRWSPPAAMAAG